jgi:hypothetical protein
MKIENGEATGKVSVDNLTKIAVFKEIAKLVTFVAGCLFFIACCYLLLWTPNKNQIVNYAIAGVMLVLSIGIIGSSGFKIKFFDLEISKQKAESNLTQLDNSQPTKKTKYKSRKRKVQCC